MWLMLTPATAKLNVSIKEYSQRKINILRHTKGHLVQNLMQE